MSTFNLFDDKVTVHKEYRESYQSGNGFYYLCTVDTFLKLWKENPDAKVMVNDAKSAVAIADRAAELPFIAKEALINALETASEMAMRHNWADSWVDAEEAKIKVYSTL